MLLLEAGGDETEVSDVPSLAGFLQLTDLDWQYKTKPHPKRAYCAAMNGDSCNWPRGKVLGGSSVLNAVSKFVEVHMLCDAMMLMNSGVFRICLSTLDDLCARKQA